MYALAPQQCLLLLDTFGQELLQPSFSFQTELNEALRQSFSLIRHHYARRQTTTIRKLQRRYRQKHFGAQDPHCSLAKALE